MADAFQPRFVDLVRNYSTTTGTSDFVLGPAVNGYSGFASVLSIGDRFYYSAIGVDKPVEREVGRGTLLANGIVQREPVSGAKMNFTTGTKSIALIAAAEWFGSAQQLLDGVDPDPALAADSDAKLATQKAVKAYVDLQSGVPALRPANNLSDLASAAASRTNLGLGSAALEAVSRFPVRVASRSELAGYSAAASAYLTESGREGLFVFDAANHSAHVAADNAQGLHVAPTSDSSGASGAWVRKFDGAVKPEWFGAVTGVAGSGGANVTANNAAWTAMMTCLAALAVNATTNFSGAHTIQFGLGTYEFSQPLDLTIGSLNIAGRGMGHLGTTVVCGATRIKCYGSTGFRVQSTNTSGASTGDAGTHQGADQTVIRDLGLEGDFSTAEAENHGIHARGQTHLQNVVAANFAGDGFRFEGNTSGVKGSVNSSTLINCHAWGCRNGMLFTGNNSGACTIFGGSFNNNRAWAYKSDYSLAQYLCGVETSNNGTVAWNDGVTGYASVVSYSGNRYFVIAGQEAGASTNAPSGSATDNTWWAYLASGGSASGIPAWTSGMLISSGGCFTGVGGGTFSGCYAESNNQGKAQITTGDMVLGGALANMVWKNSPAAKAAVIQSGTNGMLNCYGGLQSVSGTVSARLGDQNYNTANRIWFGSEPTMAPTGYSMFFNSNDLFLSYAGSITGPVLRATGPSTTQQFGTGAAVAQALYVPLLALGDTVTNARLIGVSNAAPTTGAHAVGEFVFNRLGTAGLIGWKCTTAGTPGTWEALYSGYGTSPVGYATGAGGAVAQATSKSTGVTLNKPCGQVTMNAAALAAGASVAFTVTNSQVAASDAVSLSLASGNAAAGTYNYQVDKVSAGSFVISVKNISAGSLSEALVFNFALLKAVAA